MRIHRYNLRAYLFLSLSFVMAGVPVRAWCQSNLKTMRVQVSEATSRLPVTNATITLNAAGTYSAVSDSSGTIELLVQPGRYSAIVIHPAYRAQLRDNILVHSGKETRLEFELEVMNLPLETLVVSPEYDSNEFPIDHWNVQSFAAAFYDPARVVYSNAAAVNIDDGTNHMTIRGTSPSFVQWKAEDVEIVNPNHLENGGTISDRPALNGGGVSMVSAQVLERSTFRFAPFAATYGNALSGIMDLKLRNGNNNKREHVIQASLIGIDLATEGPFARKGGASYLLNVRYSTIGLLSRMGVDFGDEKSEFADVSHVIYVPFRHGHFRLFGINGISNTRFQGQHDTALITIQKELQDIRYESGTLINGVSVISRAGRVGYFKAVAAYSTKRTSRNAQPSMNFPPIYVASSELDQTRQEKLSSLVFLSVPLYKANNLRVGSTANYFESGLNAFSDVTKANASVDEVVIQPFLAADLVLTKNLTAEAGLHSFLLPQRGFSMFQPRLKIKWIHPVLKQFDFSIGSSAQLHDPYLYLSHASNRRLTPVKSQAASLTHVLPFFGITVRNSVFYQQFSSLASDSVSGFSSINYFNEQFTIPLQQNSTARVYGYDIRVERTAGKYYFIGSASFSKTRYTVENRRENPARFDIGHNVFVTAGREQPVKDKPHFWSVDLRAIHRKGFNESGDSVPAYSTVFRRRLPSYYRIDLRLSYKLNKRAATVIWALDLQNVTAAKNVAYHYYDRITQNTETKYTLGLIPVLSYKVMF